MTKGSRFDDFLKDENIEIDEEIIRENVELKALISQRDESVTAQTEIILELKAENERLKEEINKLGKKHEDYCNTMYWQMKEQMDKYYQTLQEIKAIVEEWINNDWSCFHCRSNMDEKLKEILDLITKAEINE